MLIFRLVSKGRLIYAGFIEKISRINTTDYHDRLGYLSVLVEGAAN